MFNFKSTKYTGIVNKILLELEEKKPISHKKKKQSKPLKNLKISRVSFFCLGNTSLQIIIQDKKL